MQNKLLETLELSNSTLDLDTVQSRAEGLSYLVKMFWQLRLPKINSEDISFYIWLTNTFLSVRNKIPDDFDPKESDHFLLKDISHSLAESELSENIVKWYKKLPGNRLKKNKEKINLFSFFSGLFKNTHIIK